MDGTWDAFSGLSDKGSPRSKVGDNLQIRIKALKGAGEVLVIDDERETVIPVRVRPRVLLAGRVLSAGDVRQLTVYAEMARLREPLGFLPRIMLLYPFVGSPELCVSDVAQAWNGSEFWLVPVQVKRLDHLCEAITLPCEANAGLDPGRVST